MKDIQLITDGACLGNPGPGGWAALLRFRDDEKMFSGGEASTTNNRMELQAVIEGLGKLSEVCRVHITTDSRYVMDGFEKGWLKNWKKKGWRTAKGDPVKNKELWQALDELVAQHEVTWKWVKGHSGDPDNERVDDEARLRAQEVARVG